MELPDDRATLVRGEVEGESHKGACVLPESNSTVGDREETVTHAYIDATPTHPRTPTHTHTHTHTHSPSPSGCRLIEYEDSGAVVAMDELEILHPRHPLAEPPQVNGDTVPHPLRFGSGGGRSH